METNDEIKKDLILRDLYYSPKTGFRSAQHLFDLAVKEDSSITLKDVNDWLRKQNTFSKYKSYSNPKFFRHTYVRYLGEQVQMDLVVLGKNLRDGNINYILVVVEILSRFAFARKNEKKDASSTLNSVKEIFEEFKDKFGSFPKLVQFDEGGEFLNAATKKFYEENDITYFSSYSSRKASIVERLNRTLEEKIAKFKDSGHDHWSPYLQDIVENYNTQIHSSIGMKPSEVNIHNQFVVWGRLYGHIMNHVSKPRFKIGDYVRVLHFNPKGKVLQKYMEEKYPTPINPKTGKKVRYIALAPKKKSPFSEEIFKVEKVLIGDPTVYKLFSEEADVEVLGKFYDGVKIKSNFFYNFPGKIIKMEIIFDASNMGKFTPNQKFVMFNRMLSCSGKLREHILDCKKKDCSVEKKISLFLHLFLEFEKKKNKEIDISKIMDEEMVDDSIFSDKFCKFSD